MNTAYIALGANLGAAQETVLQAVEVLAQHPQLTVVQCSSVYLTAPIESTGPDYYNAVVAIQTPLTAPALLHVLQAIESDFGRQRPYRNAPRTLDLDILLFNQERYNTPTLTIPHPRMYQRAFVLVPLQEIAPQWVTATQLASVADQAIKRVTDPVPLESPALSHGVQNNQ